MSNDHRPDCILSIPVCMPNVTEENLSRPSAWNAFGMDAMDADYRARRTYARFMEDNDQNIPQGGTIEY